MVRRRNADGIDVLSLEQFAEIVVRRALFLPAIFRIVFIDALTGVFAPRAVDIANRQHLDRISLPHESTQQVTTLFPRPDKTHRDPIAGLCLGCPEFGWQKKWCASGSES
jgi:hypothetical protein